MDPQIIELVTREIYSHIITIVGWSIGLCTPIIISLTLAVKILWKSKSNCSRKVDELTKNYNAKQEDTLKNYYEVSKSLASYLHKSVEIEDKILDICEDLLRKVDSLVTKGEVSGNYISTIHSDLRDLTIDIGSKLNQSHEIDIVLKTQFENFLKNAETILKDIKDNG